MAQCYLAGNPLVQLEWRTRHAHCMMLDGIAIISICFTFPKMILRAMYLRDASPVTIAPSAIENATQGYVGSLVRERKIPNRVVFFTVCDVFTSNLGPDFRLLMLEVNSSRAHHVDPEPRSARIPGGLSAFFLDSVHCAESSDTVLLGFQRCPGQPVPHGLTE